ncbi:MAG: leucine-rich repeat domain-containing protein, partial [Clostridiales bacterium]|nr:leucine-rich repeat domain-containing protein [Clostridiales bacterium]
MKRLQRLLSLIITLVMLFALTGVLHAAPVSSYGYHNGGNNGSSYSWTYNSTSQELSIEMGSTNNSVNEISDEIWSNAAKVYVDTSIALSYVKIRDLKENTPVIITSSGEGYYSYIVLDGVSSSNTLKCAAKIGYFQLKNYESTELMTVLKSEEFVASSCGFDIKSNTTSIFNTPSDADQYSWFQYRGKVNSVNIPDGLKTVPAFYLSTNLNLTSVDASLNNTLTTIEYYSFANCSSLTNVSLPGTLTTIKPDAFANDPCLTDIKFDGTREQWDNITMEFTDSDGVVYFKGLILKNKVQVHFKDGSIKTMEAKANIIDDETGKFVTQSALMYEYYDTAGNFAWRYYYDKTLHVTLQSYNADSLSTAALSEFPEVLSNAKSLFIDKQASIQFGTLELSNLAGVNRVYLGATSPYNVKLNSMNSINDVFNYSDINNVVILRLNGWTCTSTPFFVDKNNKSIVYINGALPNSVITIAKGCEDPYVFNYCDKLRLEEARFEDGIETIPNSALQGNNKLTDVSIPNSVTEIEYEAFASCESLAKINIPTSVKKIGYNAFRDNKSFTDIYYNGPMAKWNQIDISGTYFVGAGPETQKIDGMVSKNLVTVHCSDGNIILPGRDDDLNITIPVPPLVVTPSPTGEPTGTPTQPPTQAPTSTATPTPTEEGFEAFVERLYTVALGRASEPEGKAFWCE